LSQRGIPALGRPEQAQQHLRTLPHIGSMIDGLVCSRVPGERVVVYGIVSVSNTKVDKLSV